jgi:hypothetical protein
VLEQREPGIVERKIGRRLGPETRRHEHADDHDDGREGMRSGGHGCGKV